MDEAFYVLEGSGTFTLNDVAHPFERGASIFIPKNSWHGIFESRSRTPPALGRNACRPGRLFP
jgi:quercetin dioxygenase-like cupin family protein